MHGEFYDGIWGKYFRISHSTWSCFKNLLYGRKIPLRLDIEPIKKNPDHFIRRYIQYAEEELCGETIV